MTGSRDRDADALRELLMRMVRDVANRRGANDADIARGAGISDATISRAFTGTQPLSLDSATRLARWMGFELRLVARDEGSP